MNPQDTISVQAPMMDFPLEDDIAGMIDTLRQNPATDSVIFALQAIEIFLHMSHKYYLERPIEVNADIRGLCRALVRAKPDAAPLVNLANDMIKPLPDFYGRSEGKRMRGDMRARVEQWREELLGRENQRILKGARMITDKARLVCHGFSTEIISTLREAKKNGMKFSVTSPEGTGKDGRTLVDELVNYEIDAKLFPDKDLSSNVGNAKMVLIGADAISDQGLVYRPGTFALSEASKNNKVPLYSICGPEKFFPSGYQPKGTSTTKNLETTPLENLTGVVTGEATLAPDALREVLGKRQIDSLLLDIG